RTGVTGKMQRGDIWFAATPGGDRPVLVLTRDPVADRIGSVVVAALTRTRRGLISELVLTPAEDGVPSDCVVNFDNIQTMLPSTSTAHVRAGRVAIRPASSSTIAWATRRARTAARSALTLMSRR